jgi:hypothetical protein
VKFNELTTFTDGSANDFYMKIDDKVYRVGFSNVVNCKNPNSLAANCLGNISGSIGSFEIVSFEEVGTEKKSSQWLEVSQGAPLKFTAGAPVEELKNVLPEGNSTKLYGCDRQSGGYSCEEIAGVSIGKDGISSRSSSAVELKSEMLGFWGKDDNFYRIVLSPPSEDRSRCELVSFPIFTHLALSGDAIPLLEDGTSGNGFDVLREAIRGKNSIELVNKFGTVVVEQKEGGSGGLFVRAVNAKSFHTLDAMKKFHFRDTAGVLHEIDFMVDSDLLTLDNNCGINATGFRIHHEVKNG